MLEQEKDLIAKNNKIYLLEITALKKNKVTSSSNYPDNARTQAPNHNRENGKSYEDRSRAREKEAATHKAKNFTLMYVISDEGN